MQEQLSICILRSHMMLNSSTQLQPGESFSGAKVMIFCKITSGKGLFRGLIHKSIAPGMNLIYNI